MAESESYGMDRAVGLCLHCSHHRRVETKRGSIFHLCMLSESDTRFAKYPRLPVSQCRGFMPAVESRDESRQP